MSRRIRTFISSRPVLSFAGLLVVGLALGLVACDADSPSEPSQPPGTPPGTGPVNASYSISINASPNQVPAGSTDPVQVIVRVTRRDTGQPPPSGTTVVVAAGAGSFGTVGGPTSVVVQTVNGQAVVSYFPPQTTGSGSVILQARLEDSIGQTALQIVEPATFFVASVQPNVGSPNGGEAVTIQGGGFESPVRVTFDGVPAQVQSVGSTRIQVITPPSADPVPVGSTVPVDVAVTINLNEEEQASDVLPSAFIYSRGGTTQQPQVFSVTPASGPNEGGTRVVINGEGFQSPVQVFFGDGNSAADFTGIEATVESVTPSRIVVVSPPAQGFGQNNLNEVVDILIRNLQSGFSTIAPSSFQYGAGGADVPFISAISVGSGLYTGGDLVTLFGQGFDAPVAVTIGGVGQSIVSVTGTEVVIRTVPVEVDECEIANPPGSGGQDVILTNIETNESTAGGPQFTYLVPEPVVTGVTPSSGSQNGGTNVTISGQGFESPVRVDFTSSETGDSFAGSVQSVSGGQIVVRTPPVPNNALAEEDCDDNGDGTSGMRYIPTSFDVEVVNLLTGCEANPFEGAFTYVPSNQSCRNDVGETEPPAPQCSDGLDNDGDGLTDFNGGVTPPGDPQCTSDGDNSESS